ncbi:uncharacterized protein JCM15063_000828 [Sporobolomyces koalae]|uniref:uncharacterized protein n=1 Tax=Sporobolomyces koalae TaxID=500713 RepID=UPI003171EBAE
MPSLSVRVLPSVWTLSVALLVLAVLGPLVLAQQINSPASLTVCAPQQLIINGGTAPYDVAALPGGATGGVPLARINPNAQEGTMTWVVNVPSGQNVTLAVRASDLADTSGETDATGATGYSAPIPVIDGDSTACLNSTSAIASQDASAPVTPASAPTSSSASLNDLSISSILESLRNFTPPASSTSLSTRSSHDSGSLQGLATTAAKTTASASPAGASASSRDEAQPNATQSSGAHALTSPFMIK